MPLSDEEQRLLDEMERNLYGANTDVHHTPAGRGRVSSRGILFGLLGLILGVIGLMVGIGTGFFLWGVLGFVAIFVGAVLALSMRVTGPPRARTQTTRRDGAGFMQRLEDRWDERS